MKITLPKNMLYVQYFEGPVPEALLSTRARYSSELSSRLRQYRHNPCQSAAAELVAAIVRTAQFHETIETQGFEWSDGPEPPLSLLGSEVWRELCDATGLLKRSVGLCHGIYEDWSLISSRFSDAGDDCSSFECEMLRALLCNQRYYM